MFTGIIQGIGNFATNSNSSNEIEIKTNLDLNDCKVGSSISCDGICLTIKNIKKKDNYFYFTLDISEETIKRSICKYWNSNSVINLEKSLKVGDEIGGHFVYGHIDTILKIKKIIKLDSSWDYYFSLLDLDKKFHKFISDKGSISINGISLTIVFLNTEDFYVSIIPHTYNFTNISNYSKGDLVNIEFDTLARYILNKHND